MSFNNVNDRLDEAVEDAKLDGYIIGTVVDNADPLGIGRIKVSIPNLYDADQGPVPWVGPHKKSPFGIGAGYGVYGSPAIGAKVKVKLQGGDAHYALAEADEYLKEHANAKFQSPNTWGFKDPSGNELWVNMSTGAWEFTHSSGTTIKHNAAGNRDTVVVQHDTSNVGGNAARTVTGNDSTTVGGESTHNVGDNHSLDVGGNLIINVSGDASITASGSVSVSGSQVNLN